jgi:hypothetical protein
MLRHVSAFGAGDEVGVLRMYRFAEADGQRESVVALSRIYGLRWRVLDAPFDCALLHRFFLFDFRLANAAPVASSSLGHAAITRLWLVSFCGWLLSPMQVPSAANRVGDKPAEMSAGRTG